MNSLVLRFLQAPLRVKLAGANALLLGAGLIDLFVPAVHAPQRTAALVLFAAAAAVNAVLVTIALRPLAAIEAVADAVTRGDYERRVPVMDLADRDVDRSRIAFNRLLDHLATENAVVRRLAGEVAHARETERLGVAHELREGVAQVLYALTLELGDATRGNGSKLDEPHLAAARAMAFAALEDVRRLAGALSPGAVSAVGLRPALDTLARRVAAGEGPRISVDVDPSVGRLPEFVGVMLYRVAEHGLRNTSLHGGPTSAAVTVCRHDSAVRLVVKDDGVGVETELGDPMYAEPGLFELREMVLQVGGSLEFTALPGKGTQLAAELPLIEGTAA